MSLDPEQFLARVPELEPKPASTDSLPPFSDSFSMSWGNEIDFFAEEHAPAASLPIFIPAPKCTPAPNGPSPKRTPAPTLLPTYPPLFEERVSPLIISLVEPAPPQTRFEFGSVWGDLQKKKRARDEEEEGRALKKSRRIEEQEAMQALLSLRPAGLLINPETGNMVVDLTADEPDL